MLLVLPHIHTDGDLVAPPVQADTAQCRPQSVRSSAKNSHDGTAPSAVLQHRAILILSASLWEIKRKLFCCFKIYQFFRVEGWVLSVSTYIIGRIQVQRGPVICRLIYPMWWLFLYGIWQHFGLFHVFNVVFCFFLLNSSINVGFLFIFNFFRNFNVQFLTNKSFIIKRLKVILNLLYSSL